MNIADALLFGTPAMPKVPMILTFGRESTMQPTTPIQHTMLLTMSIFAPELSSTPHS
jgi:hypothetical protein